MCAQVCFVGAAVLSLRWAGILPHKPLAGLQIRLRLCCWWALHPRERVVRPWRTTHGVPDLGHLGGCGTHKTGGIPGCGRRHTSCQDLPQVSPGRITQENIAARGEDLSVHDIIRLERPAWLNGGDPLVTLFIDGESWTESVQLLRDRPVTDVHEIRRIGAGAEGMYAGQGVIMS